MFCKTTALAHGFIGGWLSLSAALWAGCTDTTEVEPGPLELAQATERAAQPARNAEHPPVVQPFARGGTRLKAQHFRVGQAEQFRRFRDTELKIDCDWAEARVGIGLRCLPSRRAEVFYLDEGCTRPVVRPTGYTLPLSRGEVLPTPALAIDDLVSAETDPKHACGPHVPKGRDVYRVAELVPAAERGTLFERTQTGCVRKTDSNPEAVHRLVAQPDETVFASGFPISVDVGGGLLLRRVVGDDGSQLTLGVTDTRGAFCTPVYEGQCVPGLVQIASPSVWPIRSFGCGDSFAVCGAPEYGVASTSGTTQVFPLTTMELGPGSTGCTTALGRKVIVVAGPEITQTLPKGRRVRWNDAPIYREQIVAATMERTIPLENGGPFLDEQDRRCGVMPAADGTYRCWSRPTPNLAPLYTYVDPACKELVFYNYEPDDIDTQIVVNASQEPGGVPDYQVKELRTLHKVRPYVGESVYRLNAKTNLCEAVKDLWISEGERKDFAVLGEQVPLSLAKQVEAVDL